MCLLLEMKTKAVKFVKDDVPSFDSIEGELHNWKTKWQHQLQTHGQTSFPASPMLALRHASCSRLQLLCTFPVTSCISECFHSYLKLSTPLNDQLGGIQDWVDLLFSLLIMISQLMLPMLLNLFLLVTLKG